MSEAGENTAERHEQLKREATIALRDAWDAAIDRDFAEARRIVAAADSYLGELEELALEDEAQAIDVRQEAG